MSPQQENIVKAQLKGLRAVIFSACHHKCHCDGNVGESLNALRNVILNDLSGAERNVAAVGMPAIVMVVPQGEMKGKKKTWTESDEALRLLSQLSEMVGIESIHYGSRKDED